MVRRVWLLLGVLGLVSGLALGAEVVGLYEAEVEVNAEDSAAEAQAIERAMHLVLVKLSGDRNVATRPGIARLQKKAQNYLQQFRYRQANASGSSPLARSPRRLWVRFDPQALERALREIGAPIWGRQRPSLLIWLAVEQLDGRRLVGEGDLSDYSVVLQERAALRGLPIVLPLLDLEDEARIQVADVWAGFSEPVLAASQRYGAEAILTGTLASVQPQLWEGHWSLYVNGDLHSWSSRGNLPDKVLEEGIDVAADALARQFAEAGGAREESVVQLQVEGIGNLNQYARVQRYLKSLNSVSEVGVKRIEPDRVWFFVIARGGAQAVAQSIALGRTLQPLSVEQGHYRLLPP